MSWPFWLELLLRSSALLLAGEGLRRVGKRRSAAAEHSLLFSLFLLLGLLPVLSLLLPELHIPLARDHSGSPLVVVQEVSSRIAGAPSGHAIDWLLLLWLTGAILAAAAPLRGAVYAWRTARRATALSTPALRTALHALFPLLPVRAVILFSSELAVPVTCGILRPRILLPVSAQYWSSERLQAVLSHEFAHARRRDVPVQMAVHLIAALWWFQPLVWVLRRILRTQSELACDAEALRFGLRPSSYAAELLALARTVSRGVSFSSSALSMVRPCDFEERLRAILRPAVALPRVRIYPLLTGLLAVAVAASAVTLGPNHSSNEQGGSIMRRTILSALLASTSLSAAMVSGSISDPGGTPVEGARVFVYNPDTGAKLETVSAADGKFSLAGAAAGQYILRLEKPGLISVFREFDLKADSKIAREFTMSTEGGQPVGDKVIDTGEQEAKRIRVGGQVAQSNLTAKVQPVYPAAAKATGTQGTVEIETTISKDGVPVELRVLSSPSDDLSEASLEAVRQWRYRPTLLNGSPVEIVTDVIVNFTLSR